MKKQLAIITTLLPGSAAAFGGHVLCGHHQRWPSASGFVVEWAPSVSNRWYTMVWTNDLTGSFSSLVWGIDFPQSSATDTAHGAQSEGFYRVQVELK